MAEKYYLVTFDIVGSKGRENDYKKVEDSLKFNFGHDNYWRLVKQCAIVRILDKEKNASSIKQSISQRLGSSCNILVLRLRRGYAFQFMDKRKNWIAKGILDKIPE